MANDNNYTVPSEPLTREEEYLDAIVANTSGGGGSSKYVVDELNVTTNGIYTGTGGVNAYNPVNVNVPNSYTAGDEGKVVSSGELVSQTSTTITTNSTVDTTTNNSVTVNVANSYTVEDEGKVVSSGELVAQTSRTITGAGTYDTTTNNSVTVSEPEPVVEKDVNFYDYDGTVLYSYTAQEFLQLTEMPANPTHEGLTAQGWNWTLSQAQTYVTDYGKLIIGQMYITDDGATRLYCTFPENKLKPYLVIWSSSGNITGTIDWGDNTTPTSYYCGGGDRATYAHTYSSPGDYVISIKPETGKPALGYQDGRYGILSSNGGLDKKDYNTFINKVELGSISSIYGETFNQSFNMKTITLPNNTTYNTFISISGSLVNYITIPNNITSISANTYPFSSNNLLTISLPYGLTNTNRYGGSSSVPMSHLRNITIPNSVTTIDGNAFGYGRSLINITIPNSVTTIDMNAFQSMANIKTIKLTSTTPPTLNGGSSVFYSLPTDCIIYVPALVSDLYMTGTNYPSSATYSYVGYATYNNGDTLPTLTTDETYTLTWYATVDDAIAQTNPITQGNGNEVYSRATAVV